MPWIVAIFDALIEGEPSGGTWLPRQLRCGSAVAQSSSPPVIEELQSPPAQSRGWLGANQST